jgi:hypothetical protein
MGQRIVDVITVLENDLSVPEAKEPSFAKATD